MPSLDQNTDSAQPENELLNPPTSPLFLSMTMYKTESLTGKTGSSA